LALGHVVGDVILMVGKGLLRKKIPKHQEAKNDFVKKYGKVTWQLEINYECRCVLLLNIGYDFSLSTSKYSSKSKSTKMSIVQPRSVDHDQLLKASSFSYQ